MIQILQRGGTVAALLLTLMISSGRCVLAAVPDDSSAANMKEPEPLRLAVVGLVHGHVHGILSDAQRRDDVDLVGVFEPDSLLLNEISDRYNVPRRLRFSNLAEMLDRVRPDAVSVNSNTFDHADIVEECARRGIHVMVEKPLAVSMEHARRIQRAADESGIHVLVNYETTWYPGNSVVEELLDSGALGTIRRMVVRDGHFGPKEIGVSEAFLEWLVDPILNGGGALTDFGCFGANLMTWLMKGETPIAVTAVAQNLKSDPVYSRVDDEATIIVEYRGAVGLIEASWNWPYHRKDMDVYGDSGYVVVPRRDVVHFGRLDERIDEVDEAEAPIEDAKGATAVPSLDDSVADPLSYLRAVVSGEIVPEPNDLSSLSNNLMVTRILDAARESARTGRRVVLWSGSGG